MDLRKIDPKIFVNIGESMHSCCLSQAVHTGNKEFIIGRGRYIKRKEGLKILLKFK